MSNFEKEVKVTVDVGDILDDMDSGDILEYVFKGPNGQNELYKFVFDECDLNDVFDYLKNRGGNSYSYKSTANKAEDMVNAMWDDEDFRLAMTMCVCNSVPVVELRQYIKDPFTSDITTMFKGISTPDLIKLLKDSGRLNDLVLEMTKKIIESITTMGE